MAEAVGTAIRRALEHDGAPQAAEEVLPVHDPVFRALRGRDGYLTAGQIAAAAGTGITTAAVLDRLRQLAQDFELEMASTSGRACYRLGAFKAFLGQSDHARHTRFAARRATVS